MYVGHAADCAHGTGSLKYYSKSCNSIIYMQELLRLIRTEEVFGKVLASVHVVEFQKRGLPHAHILVILQPSDAPRHADDVDKLVCAELPDPAVHPRLYAIVTKHMLHGPCGPAHLRCPCMVERDGRNVCSKGYPKMRQESTVIVDGDVRYRRRDGGHTFSRCG